MTQPSLFDYAAARDTAMATVGRNAGEMFREQAREFVPRYLREHGPCSSEQLTDACISAGISPHDDRAFGPVYAYLARHGHTVWVGPCERAKGHGSQGGSIWRAAAQ